jgi:hypothetical protein
MDFFMRFCVSLLSIAVIFLAACGRETGDIYGFSINSVSVNHVSRSLSVRLQQDLQLSQQAREALEHGVKLTIGLEMELRNDNNMIAVLRDVRRFQLSYLPLSERYQLLDEETAELSTFPRLRHLLAAIGGLSTSLPTGPLPPGSYELRTRIRMDESRLPAPMQLPAWFSSQWQHDSEWSVWPFKVSV